MALDIEKIDREIKGGLANEQAHIREAQTNELFYRGRAREMALYVAKRPDEDDLSYRRRPKLTLGLTRRLIDVLARLYRKPPVRSLDDNPTAQAWLSDNYADNHLDAILHKADQLATLNDYCLIQVSALGDPAYGSDDPEARPDPRDRVKFHLWSRSEVAVYASDDDPTAIEAVVTASRFDNKTTYRLYTPDEIRTYVSRKLGPFQTSGGRTTELARSEPNQYGVVPFVLVPYEPLVRCLDEVQGPGQAIRESNELVNNELSDLGQYMRHYGSPRLVGKNLDPKTRITSSPGQVIALPINKVSSDALYAPSLDLLQMNLDIPGLLDWVNYLISQILLDHNIPESAVRMEQAGAKSGLALVAEAIPLIEREQQRQKLYGSVEQQLAKLSCWVGGSFYNRPDLLSAADQNVSLQWSDLRPPIPDPVFARIEEQEVALGIQSKISLFMRRYNVTRAQAEAHFEQVAKDQRFLESLGLEEDPSAQGPLSQGQPKAGLTDQALLDATGLDDPASA